MDLLKDRIKRVRGVLTYEQFGKELSKSGFQFTKGNLWRYENDDDLKPSYNFFVAVRQVFKINLNWLIVGAGDMFDSKKLVNSKSSRDKVK